jgi:hypothetical protein
VVERKFLRCMVNPSKLELMLADDIEFFSGDVVIRV